MDPPPKAVDLRLTSLHRRGTRIILLDMAVHQVSFQTSGISLGRVGLTFRIFSGGRALGELTVSRGGVRWRARDAKQRRLVSWDQLADLLDAATARPRNASDGKKSDWKRYGHMCPRCMWFEMEKRPESVDGAPWSYTHQCPACGMGGNYEEWHQARINTLEDVYAQLDCEDWDSFADWVTDYTDENARVAHEGTSAADGITSYSNGGMFGTTFEFPGNLQELMADIQTAEDNGREDWRHFTGEAARRLVPLSDVYEDFIDPERDAMPEDWTVDDDGVWSPPDSGSEEEDGTSI